MNSGISQVFQREVTCPICMNYFIDPVTIDCGHSFCRPCFYLHWEDIPILTQCFECTKSTQQRNLKTNIDLKKMASLARKVNLWLFLSSEEQKCGTHKDTKKMFCEVDRSLLCLLCSSSQEHRDHRHCPIESAAEEHQEKLLQKMQSLWEKACENHSNLNVETTRTRHWKNYVNLRLEAIRAEYQKMPAFHHEEEKHNLEMLKKKGKDIFHQLHLSKAKMAHRREILRGMYEELKEMCHKPDLELLQAFGDILHRTESVLLHMPQPLNPELSAGPITGLMDRLNQFRVHITLHHEEANSHIFLYEILRSMCIGCDHQDVPYVTATPRSFLAWGAQTFTSGKYYWEVHVGDSWNWAFGVCNMYWKEKHQNEKTDGEEGLFLFGCVKNEIQCSLFTTSRIMLQYIPRPTSRVGLFLDCEAKTVSFVDVNQSSLIYTIPNCSFSPPLRPIFCCIHF
ncbi:putative tripartite motif-containing protein 49B isoform X2 [Symphalangus syndactylus]|uniref:putative tripartite motif-containing protein 49B isoform X2 n=1 Tax=Symphalangus syndactylus TaxID=9590 RepID=UPI0024414C69|nr:putative tripartite motif-containing protein 49B isoform X2 [Symphalangus syndactylus]XP_055139192.1 putative tripartite motif-containing protein 49B isoform X2 [Symphalangus syndactylus]